MFLTPKDDRFLEIISELGRNVSLIIPKATPLSVIGALESENTDRAFFLNVSTLSVCFTDHSSALSQWNLVKIMHYINVTSVLIFHDT